MVRAGSSTYVAVGWESNFGGGASNIQLFGKDQKISSIEYTNNTTALPQLYTPEVKDFLFGRNAGSCSVEYVLSNPFQFTSILHEPVSELQSGSLFIRTWNSDPTTNGNIRRIKTMHLEVGAILNSGNVVRNAKGVITQNLNIKTGIDQPVQFNQQLMWGIEDDISTTLNSSLPTDSSFTPYNFTHSEIQMPSSNLINTVQTLDLTFNINSELLYALNNANAVDAYRKLFEITGKINLAFLNSDHLQQVRNRTEVPSMRVTFENGLSGTSLKTIIMNFTGVAITRHGNPTLSPTEVVYQDFDFQCKSVSVVSVDDTPVFDWD